MDRGKLLNILLFCGLSLFTSVITFAQESTDDKGEVVEGEFTINKNLEITLPSAQRIFQKIPPRPVQESGLSDMEYDFNNVPDPQLQDIKTKLRILKLKDEPLKFNTSNYLKVGYGNYFTPFLDVGLNSGVDKVGSYGVRYRHLSSLNGSVDKRNSGDGHNAFDVFGKYAGGKASLSGKLTYDRDKYHFYGYEPGIEVDRDTIKQVYNDFSATFKVRSNDVNDPLKYEIYGDFSNLSDKYTAKEFVGKAGFSGGYKLDESLKASLALDLFFSRYQNPDPVNRNLVRMLPSFTLNTGLLEVEAGLKVVNHNDTLNEKSDTKIFPSGKVTYELKENLSVYGIMDGDMEEITLHKLIDENPFLMSGVQLNHQTKNLELSGGIKGNFMQYFAFDAGMKAISYKNLYVFMNNPDEYNKFDVLYDGKKSSLFQIYASLSYIKSEDKGSTLRLRYNGYETNQLERAWHRPKLEVDYSLWYNFYDKVTLRTDLFVLAGIRAQDTRTTQPGYTGPVVNYTLDPAVDLNLKIDYNLSEKYGVFIHLSNIFNSKYQLHLNYPNRGLLAILGFSANF